MNESSPRKQHAKTYKLSDDYYKKGLFTHLYASAGYLNEKEPLWQLKLPHLVGETGKINEFPIFDLASLTKPLATSFLCWRSGLLDKSNKEILQEIQWIYPLFKAYKLSQRSLILDLLEHSSLLPAWHNFWMCHTDNILKSGSAAWFKQIEESLAHVQGRLKSEHSCLYSDVGYIVLGTLLTFFMKKDLGSLFRESLSQQFKDVAKWSIGFNLSDNIKPEYFAPSGFCNLRKKTLRGEVHDENAYFLGGQSGHAGLFSDPQSLELYLRHLLAGVSTESQNYRTFLKKRFFSTSSDYPGGWQKAGACLLGELIAKEKKGIWLHHFGFTGTSVFVNLDSSFYCILLTNRTINQRMPGQEIRDLRKQIYQTALSFSP